MERFRNRRVLIVGVGRTGFALINFFNNLECEIKVTDIKPIFELNKAVKRLKKIKPVPEMTFGEHRDEDFIDADVIVYGASVNPKLHQLEVARSHGKLVYSQFELAYMLCKKPVIAVCGSVGRTTVAHMIGYALKFDNKNVFVCGSENNPFINLYTQNLDISVDYVVVEISSLELQQFGTAKPVVVVLTDIGSTYPDRRFSSYAEYVETKLRILKNLPDSSSIVMNFDRLYTSELIKQIAHPVYWYSRKSFTEQKLDHVVQGSHFHDRRIHSNINYHSEFSVRTMRVVGQSNRENLLAAITACKAINVGDKAIQFLIEKFPGIPHRIEFVMEKNGVAFYNDSKSETIKQTAQTLKSFKQPVILIAGGKDNEQKFETYFDLIKEKVRILVLVGECKEKLNRSIGDSTTTYLVGSFEESILIAYQKSRTGDTILLSPGNSSSDIFRDFEERGNYFKKLVYQL